jgi:molybdopterin-synthase adenylyltransferase
LGDLRTFDVLFCCVDNFEARIRCNTLCLLTCVDFVNIGIDSRSASVEVYPFSKTLAVGCLECNLPGTVYRRIAERYSCGHLRKLSFVERKIPTTIITSTAAASLAVSLGLRLGADNREPIARRIYVDTVSGTLTQTTLGRSEGCACCGRLERQPRLFSARREVDALPDNIQLDATVVTSEPILVSYRITGEGVDHLILENASAFDSSFPETIAEDPGVVELEIRDQFSVQEIARRFAGRRMPCKFATVYSQSETVLYEFEGMHHE